MGVKFKPRWEKGGENSPTMTVQEKEVCYIFELVQRVFRENLEQYVLQGLVVEATQTFDRFVLLSKQTFSFMEDFFLNR